MRLNNVSKVKFTKIKEMLADKIEEGKITKKWIERCLPREYRRRYVKSEQSSLSGRAKKLEKIMIVDNKGKTIAGEEKPSPYNSSAIDNNSAFTQPGEEMQYSQYKKSMTRMYWKEMMVMVMKVGPCLWNQEKKHLEPANQRSHTYWQQLKSNLQFLRIDMRK